jgi:hypothetical protein
VIFLSRKFIIVRVWFSTCIFQSIWLSIPSDENQQAGEVGCLTAPYYILQNKKNALHF